ncbi:MAG: cytochrome C oxidase subunit IV family protein [Myxococcota bacterium]
MISSGNAKRDARGLLVTWVVLVSLTVGSFRLSGSEASTFEVTAWILGFATLKGHLIGGVFMEMRRAPRVWATAMSGFLVAEAALIAIILGM